MANLKISQLTNASIPLAGTEVLPIVQSGATVKVSVANLTAGRAIDATSVNKVAITAPATGATLTIAEGKTLTANHSLTLAGTDATTMTFPTTSATLARTDAANSFTGDQTLSSGNLVIGTSGKGIQGTTTNNNADAGVVGQYVSSTVSGGSPVALTSPTATNITTISLTAGDWDVAGIVGFGGISGNSIVTFVGANASSTSATINPATGIQVLMNGSTQISTVADMTAALPVYRYSLATTTTIYLVARASYTTGSIGAYGTISARRIR